MDQSSPTVLFSHLVPTPLWQVSPIFAWGTGRPETGRVVSRYEISIRGVFLGRASCDREQCRRKDFCFRVAVVLDTFAATLSPSIMAHIQYSMEFDKLHQSHLLPMRSWDAIETRDPIALQPVSLVQLFQYWLGNGKEKTKGLEEPRTG